MNQQQRPFSYAADAPAFMTAEAMQSLIPASQRLRAAVLARRQSMKKVIQIRADVEGALAAINRGAKVIQFPGA